MALPDLTGQNIQDTYQRILQVSSSGEIADGTGSLFTPVSSSHAISASYAVSSSHEIIKEISSSYAETASMASSGFTVTDEIIHIGDTDTKIKFETNRIRLYANNKVHFDAHDNGNTIISSNNGTAVTFDGSQNARFAGHITASDNISASGEIIGTINGGSF